MTMEHWNRKFMSKVESVPIRDDEVPGVPVTVLQFAATDGTSDVPGVRPARVDDLEQCVALINRTHRGRDLFRPYTLPSLLDRLEAGLAPGYRGPSERPYCLSDLFVIEREGAVIACAGLWDRGRDAWEHWRHRETGEERTLSATALLDFGFADGCAPALAQLIAYLIALTHRLQRTCLVAPLEALPDVAARLREYEPVPETRYMQWRADTPAITPPAYLDLIYW